MSRSRRHASRLRFCAGFPAAHLTTLPEPSSHVLHRTRSGRQTWCVAPLVTISRLGLPRQLGLCPMTAQRPRAGRGVRSNSQPAHSRRSGFCTAPPCMAGRAARPAAPAGRAPHNSTRSSEARFDASSGSSSLSLSPIPWLTRHARPPLAQAEPPEMPQMNPKMFLIPALMLGTRYFKVDANGACLARPCVRRSAHAATADAPPMPPRPRPPNSPPPPATQSTRRRFGRRSRSLARARSSCGSTSPRWPASRTRARS